MALGYYCLLRGQSLQDGTGALSTLRPVFTGRYWVTTVYFKACLYRMVLGHYLLRGLSLQDGTGLLLSTWRPVIIGCHWGTVCFQTCLYRMALGYC